MPNRFQIFAEIVDDENELSYCTNDIPRTLDSDVMALIQLNTTTPTCTHDSSSLKAYRKYIAWIVSKNDFGESNSTGEIPFSKSVGINTIQEHLVHIFPPVIFLTRLLYNSHSLNITRTSQQNSILVEEVNLALFCKISYQNLYGIVCILRTGFLFASTTKIRPKEVVF